MEEVQRYNVLCITERNGHGNEIGGIIRWHTPITGIAEVFTDYRENHGVKIAKTIVRFLGREYELLYVRSGLSGTAVTIGINRRAYGVKNWELYTDTPTAGHTTEEVRMVAENTPERIF